MIKLPPVIGHRGAAACAPENTLAGFRAAAACGARWVEFDVRLAADGVPVVIHDATLRRTTDGRGRVERMTAAALARLDAGSWFHGRFRGERIPTLAQALACARSLRLGVNIEVKPVPAAGAAAARAVAAALEGADPRRVLVSSFDWSVLATLAADAPLWPRGLLMRRPPRDLAPWVRRLGASTLHVAADELDRDLVERLSALGLPILAYTVNRLDRARRLLSWGVRAVFTDRPNRLIPALSRAAA
jgi:glycerophosphoryl diester phosphodiesterase